MGHPPEVRTTRKRRIADHARAPRTALIAAVLVLTASPEAVAQLPVATAPVSVPTVSLPSTPASQPPSEPVAQAPSVPAVQGPSAPAVEAPAAPVPAAEPPAAAAPVPEVTAPEPLGEALTPDPPAATTPPEPTPPAVPEPALPDPPDPLESVPAAPALPDAPSVDLPAPLPDLPVPELPDTGIEAPELPIDDAVADALEPVTPVADEVTGRAHREVEQATDVLAPVLGGGSDPPAAEPPILVDDVLEDVRPIDDLLGLVGSLDDVTGSLPPLLGGVAESLPSSLDDLLDSTLPVVGDSSDGLPSLADVVDAGGSLVAPLIEPVRAPLAGLAPPLGQAGTSLPSLLPALPGGGGGSPPPAGPGALIDAPPSGPNRPRLSGGRAGPEQAADASRAAGSPGEGALVPDSVAAAGADGLAAVSPAGEPPLPLGSSGPRPLAHPRGSDGTGLTRRWHPFGWATPAYGLTGTAVFASALLGASPAASEPAAAVGGDAPSSPQAPAPSGAAAGSGAAGVASSTLFALLVSLAAFALRHFTRLQLAPARWRPQAFVAVLERPG